MSLAGDISTQRDVIKQAEAAIAGRAPRRHQTQQQYWQERTVAILGELRSKERAVCAACKKLRPRATMRCLRKSGFSWQSDYSYSQWTEYYSNDLPICLKCSAEFTFQVESKENKPVGTQLLPFDAENHDVWLRYQEDLLSYVEVSFQLGLPSIAP